ncbi:MAG: hypothetical protein H0T50_17080 [Gemmatimonadales bacterium]|nr:hypothetical protein [Gemmatimonadales bacterium]
MQPILMAGLLVALAAGSGDAQESPAATRPAAGCHGAEYRQFDFWIGDWNTYEIADSSKVVARTRVSAFLDGCVLREDYRQNDGLAGESYSLWDASRGVWHQSWVTNRGTLLLLDGRFRNGRMVLTGSEKSPDGTASLLRGTWWMEGRDVRERAERSADGGKSWTPVFDIVFRPHRP